MQYAMLLLQAGTLSINKCGEIWRHAAIIHGVLRPVPARRAENVGGKGYLRLTLQIDGRLKSVMAHRVVWTWLVGPIPSGLQINHKDLNKQNNRRGNLELVTGGGNIRHSYDNGRPAPWHKATTWRGRPRVSDEMKACIRAARGDGRSLKDISVQYALSVSHIHRITSQ